MTMTGYVNCPEHGTQQVTVDVDEHRELCARYTAPCPKCGRRLSVTLK